MSARRTIATSIIFGATFALTSGCGALHDQEGDRKTSDDNLFIASTKVWPNHTIYVCWMPTAPLGGIEPTAPGKELVRLAVEAKWGTETGLAFKGWELCNTSDTQSGIRILYGNYWPNASRLGSDLGVVDTSGGTVKYPNLVYLNFAMSTYRDAAGNQPWPNCVGSRSTMICAWPRSRNRSCNREMCGSVMGGAASVLPGRIRTSSARG